MATYRATLVVQDTTIASITLNANSDADAKKQLKSSTPEWSAGIGEWKLTKVNDAVAS